MIYHQTTSGRTTLNIDNWLNGMRLGRYAPVFRSNEIDDSLLRGLTGDDLKEMGSAGLGIASGCYRRSPRSL